MPSKREQMQQHFADMKQRREQFQEWLQQWPVYTPDMVVKCPTHNYDGSPILDDDIQGCGSTNVVWDGDECYDCHNCGIFFAPYAADPPHRRERDPDNTVNPRARARDDNTTE